MKYKRLFVYEKLTDIILNYGITRPNTLSRFDNMLESYIIITKRTVISRLLNNNRILTVSNNEALNTKFSYKDKNFNTEVLK